MRRDEFRRLLEYDAWATDRVLAAAARLETGRFAMPAAPGQPPFGALFSHYFLAREGFRGVVAGTPRKFRDLHEQFDAMDWSTVDGCAGWLRDERSATAETLAVLPDADLERIVTVGGSENRRQMAAWEVITHLVNHGTHHRAEIAALLTDLGQSPGDLDFIVFAREYPATP